MNSIVGINVGASPRVRPPLNKTLGQILGSALTSTTFIRPLLHKKLMYALYPLYGKRDTRSCRVKIS
jgi:hypothetical protein